MHFSFSWIAFRNLGYLAQKIIQGSSRLHYGDVLTEKLLVLGEWIDGVTTLPFDPHVANELDRTHDNGHEILKRLPIWQIGQQNLGHSERWNDWDSKLRDWMDNVERYVSQHMHRADAHMFRTIEHTRPQELKKELSAKIQKLRLITGRKIARDDGTREISES